MTDIAGTKADLETLRDAIDAALRDGEGHCDFNLGEDHEQFIHVYRTDDIDPDAQHS